MGALDRLQTFPPPAPLAAVVHIVPATLPSTLLERNPTVAAAERQMQVENAQIGGAIGAYFPTVSLTGLCGYAGNPLSKLVNLGNRIWSLGVSSSDTLFQGGYQSGGRTVGTASVRA